MNTENTINFKDLISDYKFLNCPQDTFILGKTEYDELKTLSINKITNMLICGISGSGKSNILNNIITSLVLKNSQKDLKLLLINSKNDFDKFENLPHLMKKPVKSFDDALNVLNLVNEELGNRFNQISEAGYYDFKSYNKNINGKNDKLPLLLVVIDEVDFYNNNMQFNLILSSLIKRTRCAGISFILTSQSFSNSDLNYSIQTIVALKSHSEDDSYNLLGTSGAENLEDIGELLLKENNNYVTKINSVFVDSKTLTKIIEEIK